MKLTRYSSDTVAVVSCNLAPGERELRTDPHVCVSEWLLKPHPFESAMEQDRCLACDHHGTIISPAKGLCMTLDMPIQRGKKIRNTPLLNRVSTGTRSVVSASNGAACSKGERNHNQEAFEKHDVKTGSVGRESLCRRTQCVTRTWQ